ncbi:mycofactocin system transcriptional regulator [Amycolatopsis xylanica]|uniref:Mycofactocin system transcriptional regulator n=1 Tax=Amycolatopsis xylanica TaxID=589385 RepID=A0A1H3A4I0_9PSEU|nr:mycofactocin system transcriptional regulator [Amycolatopsis xylanica]
MEGVSVRVPAESPDGARHGGRRKITSKGELEHIAFALFDERGFDHTTIDDIAAAAGIGRRTFFRYFPSKNDIAWGSFDEQLVHMHARFRACAPELPLMDAIREVVVGFNSVEPEEVPWHRRRLSLILNVPALQAHSTLRYADWRRVVADFVAERLNQPANSLEPQAISHAVLGVAVAAYEQWLSDEGSELIPLLDKALRDLASGFKDV